MGRTQQLGNYVNGIFQDASNNIGIGGSPSGSYKFEVTGTARVSGLLTGANATFGSTGTGNNIIALSNNDQSNTRLRITNTGSGGQTFSIVGGNPGASNAGLAIFDETNSATRLYVGSTGNVGIGTGSPSVLLNVVNSDNSTNSFVAFAAQNLTQQVEIWYGGIRMGGTAAAADLNLASKGAANMLFSTNSIERMRITGGDLLIGTTTSVGQKFRIYQSSTAQWNIKLIQPDGSNQLFQEFLTTTDNDATNSARGSIRYNGTNVLYLGTSDYRLKEDLKDYNGLNIISQIKTYDFNWKEANKRDYGVMAHELQEILPNYVTGTKDDINEDGSINPQQVDYSKLVPVLVKAIQEQQAQIEILKQIVATK
jgi:hypothetical protein